MYSVYDGVPLPFSFFLTAAQLRAGFIYTYEVTDVFVDQGFYAITPVMVSASYRGYEVYTFLGL